VTLLGIFEETIKRYGVVMQLDVLIEECAELIKVVQKWKRKQARTPNAHVTKIEIISEAVDVEIMLEQLKHIFPDPLLWVTIKNQKLERMKERMK